jgi:ABC-type enterochelin transport system ATPase subunit
MGQIDTELLFEQKLTNEMNFESQFEKIPCFRVMDENGKIVNNGGYEKLIPIDKLKKIYETMVTINEADQVFNAA